MTASTPKQEIKRVVYSLYQKVVDEGLRFQDFVIIYPDSSYVNDLIDALEQLHIPHSLPQTHLTQYDYSYQKILKALQASTQTTFHEIAKKSFIRRT